MVEVSGDALASAEQRGQRIPSVMQIDWQTLQDLGILRSEGSQASLYDWANFTSTPRGADLLREHFRRPSSDAEELRRTQGAVAWLTEHALLFDPLLGRGAWTSVEHYLGSSITALDYPNRLVLWLDSWFTRYLHADLFREVEATLALIQSLVRHAGELEERIRSLQPPPLIAEWAGQLRTCIQAAELARIVSSRPVHRLRPPRVLSLDHALRRTEFAPLRELADLVYRIDVLRSHALATRRHSLVLPEILDGDTPFVEAAGLYHPLLDHPIANRLDISSDRQLIFLTGPNMAGKSTYLKATGVAVFLAQMGMGVPARQFRLAPFTSLFSGIDTTDNLRLGQSYFYREVRRVRDAADLLARGEQALVIFDEMFKGTNLKDASDACLEVLSAFAACSGSAFLVASHLAELAAGLRTLHGIRFLHFAGEVNDEQVRFDYQLREGVSEQRLGMLILERDGVLERLRRLRG